jgi:HlyD family secretion protein
MSASVEIQTERVENILVLPIEAVTTRGKNDLDTTQKQTSRYGAKAEKSKEEVEVVFVCGPNNKLAIRRVKTGIQDDKVIFIKEGIAENEEVASGPYSAVSRTLKHGGLVQKVTKEQLFEAPKEE